MSSLDMDVIGAVPGGYAAASETDLVAMSAPDITGAMQEAPVTLSARIYPGVKRLLDIVLASLLLVIALPVMAVMAIAVKRSSPGDIIFRQTRIGQDGAPFTCYKFRTMVTDAEWLLARDAELMARFASAWKLDADPRITRLGAFLRKTSLDELPQLVNVLKGEMSLVGPRPVQPSEYEQHYAQVAHFLTTVTPGLTGLWQVSGRSNLSYSQRVQLDVEYARSRTLALDLKILLLTIPAIILRVGAR